MDGAGNVVVADHHNDRIVVFRGRRVPADVSDTERADALRQELARLRGTRTESLEARELAQLRAELEEGMRRVRDAEERVASQPNVRVCVCVCLSV